MTQAVPTLVVLGTGGTIAGRGASGTSAVGYRAGEVGVEALVEGLVPEGATVEAEQIAQLDSKDMDAATWLRLASRIAHHAARDAVRGVVVTHGTDTLEETAWWLARTSRTGKPVVVTAAMRPATSRSPDGPQNLADALAVAATDGATGVVAVLAGRIHGAADVRKAHPYRVEAFSSGDAGPIGYVEEGRVRLLRAWPTSVAGAGERNLEASPWPWVEIVSSTAAADARAVPALVAAGVAGLVVATTGNGQIHRVTEAALRAAQRHGVAVLRCLRAGMGGTIVAGSEAGASGAASPFESAGALGPAAARVELIVRLLGVD